jgi:hypothetical protein
MKQSDITTVILIGVIGLVVSYILVNTLLPEMAVVSYKGIEPIDTVLAEPDSEVFNIDAINPTLETYIGSCDTDRDGVVSTQEAALCDTAPTTPTDDGSGSQSSGGLQEDPQEGEEDDGKTDLSGTGATNTGTTDENTGGENTGTGSGNKENNTNNNGTGSDSNSQGGSNSGSGQGGEGQ